MYASTPSAARHSARLDPAVAPRSRRLCGLLQAFQALARIDIPRRHGGRRRSELAPSVPAFELYVRGLVASSAELQERYLSQAVESGPRVCRRAAGAVGRAAAPRRPRTGAGDLEGVGAERSQPRRRRPTAASLANCAATTRPSPPSRRWSRRRRGRRGRRTCWGSCSCAGGRRAAGRAYVLLPPAVEREPANADYCFNLGYAYWHDKDTTGRRVLAARSVRRNPADGDAHFVLAAALAAQRGQPRSRARAGARPGGSPSAGRQPGWRHGATWARAGEGSAVGVRRRVDSVLQEGVQRDQREASAFHRRSGPPGLRGRPRSGYDPRSAAGPLPTPLRRRAHLLLGRALARSGLLQEAVDALKVVDLERRDRGRARRAGRRAVAAARHRRRGPGRRSRAGPRAVERRGGGTGGAGSGGQG